MPLITAVELAAQLKKHPRTIIRLARTRQIPGSKIGKDWYFDLEEVVKAGRPAEARDPRIILARTGMSRVRGGRAS